MITKRDLELVRSLSASRERSMRRLFLAEGVRLVGDMLGTLPIELLVIGEELYPELEARLSALPEGYRPRRIEVVDRGFAWRRLSHQTTPQPLLALFDLPSHDLREAVGAGLILMLDRVQDPGNMGTIIRSADWFGVEHILLTDGCADPYAPKVVQSTMGALSRVKLHPLGERGDHLLAGYEGSVLGTLLEGENIYRSTLPRGHESALLLMGNEGNGIAPYLEPYLTHRLTIPSFATHGSGAESLNVAIAASICLSELRRSL